MIIFLNKPSIDGLIELDCDPSWSIIQLKEAIKEKKETGEEVPSMMLTFQSQLLLDSKTLQDYDIKEYSTIYLNILEKHDFQTTQALTTLPPGCSHMKELQNWFREQRSGDSYICSINKLSRGNYRKTRILKLLDSVRGLIVFPENKYIIVGYLDTSFEIFDYSTKEVVHTFPPCFDLPEISYDICYSPFDYKNIPMIIAKNNKHLFAGMFNGKIAMFDLSSMTRLSDLLEEELRIVLFRLINDKKL